MAENSTLVTLPQLIDLSLNCPDMGSINYNILHILLHVLLQQVEQTDVGIEFRGEDSDRIQGLISAMRPKTGLSLSKYEVCSSTGAPLKKRRSKKNISLQDVKAMSKEEKLAEQEINVIEPRKVSTVEPSATPAPLKSPPTSQGQLRKTSKTASQTVVVVDSASKLPQFSIAVTKSNFDNLVEDVNQVKSKLNELTDLPANLGLIEATRSPSNPVLDMFQILNLTKRMDAAEEGMSKVASLVEDLAREQGIQGTGTTASEDRGQKQSVRQSIASSVFQVDVQKKEIARMIHLEKRIKKLERISKKILEGGDVTKVEAELATETEEPEPVRAGSLDPIADSSILNKQFSETLDYLQIELDKVKHWIETEAPRRHSGGESPATPGVSDEVTGGGGGAAGGVISPGIEKKFAECLNKVAAIDQAFNGQINTLEAQMGNLQKEVGDLLLKINMILPGGDNDELNIDNQRQLYDKLKQLEKDVGTINEAAGKLQEDKEERDKSIQAMLEQIDLLKLVKANREDLEDALDDKADACLINRKVSHDQFDAACDDLTKGIEQAIDKLTQQEDLWKQALHSIQRDIGNKLDKTEVDPLRDFVNNKLKALQEKFKSLTALKREQEAAGTKSKFLRNVNCISCDKDVVMRKEMDSSLKPQPFSAQPNRNIAPYLAYELDQLRKQQKCMPNSKNLNFFENAMKQKMTKDKTHICNRYCGGSHTVTTPQQRVTRLGHFLEQWGPEISPLNDEFVKGNNNRMYKARDDVGLKKMVEQDRSKSANNKDEVVAIDTGNRDDAVIIDPDAENLVNQVRPASTDERRHSRQSQNSKQ